MREAGTEETRTKLDAASMVATSRVAYPEARAALARFVVVELSAKVAKLAEDLAERRALRGFDAIHLASAREIARARMLDRPRDGNVLSRRPPRFGEETSA